MQRATAASGQPSAHSRLNCVVFGPCHGSQEHQVRWGLCSHLLEQTAHMQLCHPRLAPQRQASKLWLRMAISCRDGLSAPSAMTHAR
jgi:hypothetical protein